MQRLNTARIKKGVAIKILLVDSPKSRAEGKARVEFNKKFNSVQICRFVIKTMFSKGKFNNLRTADGRKTDRIIKIVVRSSFKISMQQADWLINKPYRKLALLNR